MSIFDFESVAVVAKFQTQLFRFVAQSCFEVRSVSVLEGVGQRFLADVEKIFLPGRWKLRQFTLRLKRSVDRRTGGCVLDTTFKSLPKILILQCLRTQRVRRPARFGQAAAGQFAGPVPLFFRVLAASAR